MSSTRGPTRADAGGSAGPARWAGTSGDVHIFRNARSIIEEYTYNTSSERRKNVLFESWTHFLSFYRKRTLSTTCYELYQQHFMA